MTLSGRSLRLLCQIDWPTGKTSRLWQGAGPVVDADGNLWQGSVIVDGLDEVDAAINGEASVLSLALAGVSQDIAALAWLEYTNDQIIGADVQILVQECDRLDQPVGDPEVRFTGEIDDVLFSDIVDQQQDGSPRPVSTITVEVANLFTLRRLSRGAVLSDTDQRARSAVLNPGGAPDRICERVSLLLNKTVKWPKWN